MTVQLDLWMIFQLTCNELNFQIMFKCGYSTLTLVERGRQCNEEYREERVEIWLVENCWFWDTTVCKDCTLFIALLTSCVRAVSFEDKFEYWILSVDTCWCSFDSVPWIALSFVWTSCKSLESVRSLCWFSEPKEVREWLINNKYWSMDAMRFKDGCSPKTVALRNSSFLIRSTSTCCWPVTEVVRIWRICHAVYF